MKNGPVLDNRHAFTLIEMLVVIAIIGILASMLLAALGPAKINAQRKVVQVEEANLVGAIEQYYATYSRPPASTTAVNAALGETTKAPNPKGNNQIQNLCSSNDFTFGTEYMTSANGSPQPLNGLTVANAPYGGYLTTLGEGGRTQYQNDNSEVMAILRDDNFFPEFNSATGQGHIYNPQQTSLFNAKAGGTNTIGNATGAPGLGTDEVLRDLWGNPYIITLDMNFDNHAFDPYLDQMYYAQYKAHFSAQGHAVVWSLGPYFKNVDVEASLNTVGNRGIVHSP